MSGVITSAKVKGSSTSVTTKSVGPTVITRDVFKDVFSEDSRLVIETTPDGRKKVRLADDTEQILASGREKAPVRVLVVVNISLSGAPSSSNTDGITVLNQDRLALVGQTNQTENGIYVFNGTGLVRASDADRGDKLPPGTWFRVMEGDYYADVVCALMTTGVISVGATNLDFDRSLYSPAMLAARQRTTTGQAQPLVIGGQRVSPARTGIDPNGVIVKIHGAVASSHGYQASNETVQDNYGIALDSGLYGDSSGPLFFRMACAAAGGGRPNDLGFSVLGQSYVVLQALGTQGLIQFEAPITSTVGIRGYVGTTIFQATKDGFSLNGAPETNQNYAFRLGISTTPASNPTSAAFIWTTDGTFLFTRRPGSTAYCGAGFRAVTSDDDLTLTAASGKQVKLIAGAGLFVKETSNVTIVEGQGTTATAFQSKSGTPVRIKGDDVEFYDLGTGVRIAILNDVGGGLSKLTGGDNDILRFDQRYLQFQAGVAGYMTASSPIWTHASFDGTVTYIWSDANGVTFGNAVSEADQGGAIKLVGAAPSGNPTAGSIFLWWDDGAQLFKYRKSDGTTRTITTS